MSTMPEKFRFLRAEKSLTQQELADILNCKKQNVSNIEVGHQNPTVELMQKMADKLDTNLNWLIADDGDPFNNKSSQNTTDNIIKIPYWEGLPEGYRIPDFNCIVAERDVIKHHWYLNPDNLRIVPMIGDKMADYWYKINASDILIIDTSFARIIGNGVYFATSQNNTRYWIREMQVLVNNDVQIKGFAPSGETTKTFTHAQLDAVDFRIIGKVIKNVSFRL